MLNKLVLFILSLFAVSVNLFKVCKTFFTRTSVFVNFQNILIEMTLFDIEVPLPPPPIPKTDAKPIPQLKLTPRTVTKVEKIPKSQTLQVKNVKQISIKDLNPRPDFYFFEPDVEHINESDVQLLVKEINK
eukprot:NODE_799_length_4136_cov_0.244488.p2 type:complete len:131 gc:universal NODE_799_length_4136_cov_0.244488:3461-3853(+)